MPKLLLATRNAGKARELAELLKGVPFTLTSLAEEGIDLEVEETGRTFEDNAGIKARAYAQASGLLTLADDSGLEVEALGWEPGVRSSRYAGPGASDAERVQYLLRKLGVVPPERRFARFRCVIALADASGWLVLCDGVCEGRIATEARGEHGFGYDPVFELPEQGRTMAELTSREKSEMSHRGKAVRKARELLIDLDRCDSLAKCKGKR